jgi:hypothetical protein
VVSEPDALYENQPLDCGGANASQAFTVGVGAGGGNAWGWADDACGTSHVYLCRTSGTGLSDELVLHCWPAVMVEGCHQRLLGQSSGASQRHAAIIATSQSMQQHSCHAHIPCLPASLAAPGSFHMTTAAGGSFTLVTAAANFSAADAACRQQGSHLARYGSLAEQKEVEGYFISSGEI